MADMCYYGNVMTTTRWRICVTMATLWEQQDGGYVLLWKRYDNNKMADMCYYGNVMTKTRWRICVTMETLWQQNWQTSSVYDCTVEDVEYIYWACYRFILHLQQYSHRLNLLYFFILFLRPNNPISCFINLGGKVSQLNTGTLDSSGPRERYFSSSQ